MACPVPIYLPASFKGVSFECLNADVEVGRRGAEGEFPFGEDTAYQDLGRSIRKYNLTGRTTGTAHVAESLALMLACESTGPGTLIHPTRGILRVACKKAKFKEDLDKGAGVTEIELEFVEANDFFAGTIALAGGVALSVISVAIQTNFNSSYNLAATPFYARDDVRTVSNVLLTSIRDEMVGAFDSSTPVPAWEVAADLDAAKTNEQVHNSAANLFNAVAGAMYSLDTNVTSPEKKYAAFSAIASTAAKISVPSTSAGSNINQVLAMVRLMATTYMARLATELSIDTLDAALVIFDRITAIINQEEVIAKAICSNCLFLELRKFKISAQASMLHAAYRKPAIVTYDFLASTPSLIAAHEIYGTAKRFAEIERRNPLSPPYAMGPEIQAVRGVA